MKTLLIPLLLSLAASTAIAHGTHDDETFVPLRPGAATQKPAPTMPTSAEAKKRAEKRAKDKAAKKSAETATLPAEKPAAAAPTP